MPLYDFRCNACGAGFEAQAPLGGSAPCPQCASGDVQRLLTGFSGPFTIRPRGLGAQRADATRRGREEARQERKAAREEQRKSG